MWLGSTSRPGRALSAAFAALALGSLLATPAIACSPPFGEPTIRALGPAQVVVVGTIGEQVPAGRLFHVERAYNGGVTATPIVIAFKEGEPIGDCSYPVSTGARLIIAPYRELDGRLSADLSTLQADPATDVGRRYVDEAVALFGPGIVPTEIPAAAAPESTPDLRLIVGTVVAGVLLLALMMVLARRRPAGPARR